MRRTLFSLLCLWSLSASAQSAAVPDSTQPIQTVDAACGQCKFGLKGKGCSLAVRTGGKAFFVDGSAIDDHGDAHAGDGFCNKVRQAQVQGRVVDGRFKATYFKLLPEAEKGKGKPAAAKG